MCWVWPQGALEGEGQVYQSLVNIVTSESFPKLHRGLAEMKGGLTICKANTGNLYSWAHRKLSPLSPLSPLNILLPINGPLLS